VIRGLKVLALIPARGGSKGVPGKNIRFAGGKPLIAWTIEAALAARYIDQVALSSDEDHIITVAREWGCDVPFRRPEELATDVASSMDVVLHALSQLPGFDWVVVLQPTSPLRTAVDIDAALECCVNQQAPACVSVTEAEQSPYWMYRLDDSQHLSPVLADPGHFTRRQDLPTVYALNGGIYVAECAWLQRTRTFVTSETVGFRMPQSRSIDIDTELDFIVFEKLAGEVRNA
jgi:CMP-N,N'-diacetyllegionaminic acid synthase